MEYLLIGHSTVGQSKSIQKSIYFFEKFKFLSQTCYLCILTDSFLQTSTLELYLKAKKAKIYL